MHSRERKERGDNEGLGRLERPRRPGEERSKKRKSGRLEETVRDWED